MHSQNQVPLIISLIDRLQLTTGVQVQGLLHVLTVRHQQNQELTVVLLRVAAAVGLTAVAVAVEAVVHIQVDLLQADQVEVPVDQAALREAVRGRPVVAHLQDAGRIIMQAL